MVCRQRRGGGFLRQPPLRQLPAGVRARAQRGLAARRHAVPAHAARAAPAARRQGALLLGLRTVATTTHQDQVHCSLMTKLASNIFPD